MIDKYRGGFLGFGKRGVNPGSDVGFGAGRRERNTGPDRSPGFGKRGLNTEPDQSAGIKRHRESPKYVQGENDLKTSITGLRSYVADISRLCLSGSGSLLFSLEFEASMSEFDSGDIQEKMIYIEEGAEHFSIFAGVIESGQISYDPHEDLFRLSEGLLKLKLLKEQVGAGSAYSNLWEETALNVAIRAAFFDQYLWSLLENIKANTFLKVVANDPDLMKTAGPILNEAQGQYLSTLQHIGKMNADVWTMKERNQIPKMPVVPLALGETKDEETILLNIYFNKEMGEKMLNHLANLQASGLRGHFKV